MPRITAVYGEDAFQFQDNAISVTIPLTRLNLWNPTGGNPPVNPSVNPPVKADDIQGRIIEYCQEPRSVLEIAEMLGFKDKKTVRKYLNPLLEQRKILRTIPDKPNSRNQKYITINE